MKILQYTLSRKTWIETISMPKDAMILSVARVGTDLVVWVSAMDEHKMKDRTFELVYTGKEIDDVPRFYFGSVQFDQVLHVFERLS